MFLWFVYWNTKVFLTQRCCEYGYGKQKKNRLKYWFGYVFTLYTLVLSFYNEISAYWVWSYHWLSFVDISVRSFIAETVTRKLLRHEMPTTETICTNDLGSLRDGILHETTRRRMQRKVKYIFHQLSTKSTSKLFRQVLFFLKTIVYQQLG